MHFELDVDGSGFALLPPGAMDDIDDEVRFALNAVLDPEGRTCAALDWQEASWELARGWCQRTRSNTSLPTSRLTPWRGSISWACLPLLNTL
jgi:hypothetical protein